ncbi:MAG: MFS transporter [Deltaproteobacteria bacterium]|nr:MFS transporter [Deltaproteobacteria bacterium]
MAGPIRTRITDVDEQALFLVELFFRFVYLNLRDLHNPSPSLTLSFYQARSALSTPGEFFRIPYAGGNSAVIIRPMKLSPLTFFSLAAVCQIAGSSGAAMLAPFFMAAHGYSIGLAGIPLVVNGAGRVCSDLMSGVLASYFSSGILIVVATMVGLVTSIFAIYFLDTTSVFLVAFTILGMTEAMFALSIRKIAFEESQAGQQGRAQGQVASALGIGFAIGPLIGGFVGKSFGPDVLFVVYALPQFLGLILLLLGGAHRFRKITQERSVQLLREGQKLLSRPSFLASCLAIFQSFLFLVGVNRVAFPFLAVNQGGFGLDWVGTMVSVSRVTDTFGRYTGGWLCDRITASRVILLGVLIGIPMFLLQPYGTGVATLLIPLCVMTMGFGYTNVGATTFALQSAGSAGRGLSLGLTRTFTSLGNMLGPLLAGALVQRLGYEKGFQTMGAISIVVFFLVWRGLKQQPAGVALDSGRSR